MSTTPEDVIAHAISAGWSQRESLERAADRVMRALRAEGYRVEDVSGLLCGTCEGPLDPSTEGGYVHLDDADDTHPPVLPAAVTATSLQALIADWRGYERTPGNDYSAGIADSLWLAADQLEGAVQASPATSVEVDPTELLPGDVVASLGEHEESGCHCDVRVTVWRRPS